jgi:hypothetical protein
MGNDRRPVHQFVAGQQLLPAAAIADQQFAEHELVTGDLVASQETVQPGSKGSPVGDEPDPHRRVDQDTQAVEYFAEAARSRRRGISRACGSEPRRPRKRS